MKKYTLYFIKAFILLIMLSGCDKSALDTEPRDALSFEKAMTTLEGLEGAILGVYDRGRYSYTEFDVGLFKIFNTDIIKEGSIRDEVWAAIAYFDGFDATNEGIRNLWNAYYEGLNRANRIIENINNVEYNLDNPNAVARRNTVLGEALFFRAHFHLTLVEYWDNIFLADKVYNDPEQEYALSPKEDVYELIVSDLEEAIVLLPEATDVISRGKVSKGVARHMLSLAHLDLGNWEEAAALAEEVIADPAYDFAPLDEIFSENYEENSEIIFSWQFIIGGAGNQIVPCLTSMYDRCNGVARTFEQGGRPYGRMLPTEYYWSLFEEDDLRLEAWHKRYWIYDINSEDDPLPQVAAAELSVDDPPVVDTLLSSGGTDSIYYFAVIGDTVTEVNIEETGGYGIVAIAPTTKKYWEGGGLGRVENDAESWKNVIQYRYSEAYLVAAEGYMRSGTNIARGQELFDTLRARAGQDPIELNQDNLLDEQARELGHEGRRYPMLKRLGILRERVQLGSPVVGVNMLPHHERWPIPQDFVDLTGVPQNEGYE